MDFCGMNKTTLLDYPGHVAATLFTGGCNMRCPFCHNSGLVLEPEAQQRIGEEEALAFLKKRQGILEGVCITGGEPTLQSGLEEFIRRARDLGYLVKLDTNGTNPQMLRDLIQAGLIDHCAMDIKNSPEKYAVTTGLDAAYARPCLAAVSDSIELLMHQNLISYEFRTTIVKELHDEADMRAVSQWIAGAEAYFLQSYTDSAGVLCDGFQAHTEAMLHAFTALCRRFVPSTALRGVS